MDLDLVDYNNYAAKKRVFHELSVNNSGPSTISKVY